MTSSQLLNDCRHLLDDSFPSTDSESGFCLQVRSDFCAKYSARCSQMVPF